MKILFDHPSPFLLAHGGLEIQIQETKRALEALGITIEYLRWWDTAQRGDLIHFFGRVPAGYIDLAHKKNIRVVMSELLTGLGSRSAAAIAIQKLIIGFTRAWLPAAYWARMGWDAYLKADCVIALTAWESELMQRVFGATADRLAVIPNGVAEEFLTKIAPEPPRGEYLLCVGTITQRKRVVETVLAALAARTPLWVIGKPYAESDSYAQRFLELAKRHSDLVRYEGPIGDPYQLAQAYRQARGFVLLSNMESLSLSALEAAACECPLLLSDLPWARIVFTNSASYCPITSEKQTVKHLREFYVAAPNLKPLLKPLSWREVAKRLQSVYETVLRTSR